MLWWPGRTTWQLAMAGLLAGLLIGLLWQFLGKGVRQVGITHVMERLAYHQGRLP